MNELYLGKIIREEELTERFEHRLEDLVTHTFICGASGSGKTVMGKIIVEEVALQGVPAIVIDLKGDLSSLALAFSELSAPVLAPWIQTEQGKPLGRAALAEANTLRANLLSWGLTEADIRRLAEHVSVEIFTPKSDRGRRIALPLIPAAPEGIDILFNDEPDTALAMVSSLAESVIKRILPSGRNDRELELLTAIIEYAWRNKVELSGEQGITQLIDLVLNPPFENVGALAVEKHLSDNKRQNLAQALNGQLIGAGASWLKGEELTIDKLAGINRSDERTQISVINLSAVHDFEDQCFVVAQIAFGINSWMRQQGSAPGGSKPRLLFFIDEIGGGGGKTAFYPSHPYSSTAKPALNMLIRQGRAFGIGCLLATQNPGDVDYKGLSNCSTWIIGKLQTNRDRAKIREGLSDAEFSPSVMTQKLASAQSGQFMIMTREGNVSFIQERWLLTYHCTLSPEQLDRLKTEGLAPYEGSLDTTIQSIAPSAEPETANSTEYLWHEVHEALGLAHRHLEAILDINQYDRRAQIYLEILRDPKATYKQLQTTASQKSYANEDQTPDDSTTQAPSSLIELLGKTELDEHRSIAAKSVINRTFREQSPPSSIQTKEAPKSPENTDVVDEEGYIVYKGKRYALYRRYSGKEVEIIEDEESIKFLIDGRVLSKTYLKD